MGGIVTVEGQLGDHLKRIRKLEASFFASTPGVGGPTVPATKYTIFGCEWFLYYNTGFSSGFSPVRDNTAPFGGYFQSTSQNAYIILGCPLGPAESRWCMDLWWSEGSDYGKFDLEWQTQPALVTAGGVDLGPQAVSEPDSGGSWYNTAAGGTVWQIDAYNATPRDIDYDDQMCLFSPVGDPGDMLTADGTDASGVSPWFWSNTALMNGGADGDVWWFMRLKVKTKSGSSSGYRCRIHGLRIRREISGGWTPF